MCLLIIGNILAVTKGFDENPTFTDTFGDGPAGSYEDIKYVWVDNNETFIKFKIEFAAPFNISVVPLGTFLKIFISLDNTTGTPITDIKVHYDIRWFFNGPELYAWDMRFRDYINDTNTITTKLQATDLVYFRHSNNYTTMEIEYRLKSVSGFNMEDVPMGIGYLNVALGQNIAVKFEMGWSDWAPNATDGAIPYTLKGGPAPPSGIPGFESVFVVTCIFTLFLFSLERRHLSKP